MESVSAFVKKLRGLGTQQMQPLSNYSVVFQDGLRTSATSGLLKYTRGFAPAMRDGEAMTAATVTLDSLPMKPVSV